MWLLLDKDSVCRCLASLPQNLHQDKVAAGMDIYELEAGPYTVGDEYNPSTDTWIPHPENYPQPSEEELEEAAITAEIARMNREQARINLALSPEAP